MGAPPKRARGGAGGRRLSPKQIAQMIQIKERQAYPYQTFGKYYMRRGTPENIARVGATWKAANAEQRAVRAGSGYTGRGLYMGRGKYNWQKAGNKTLNYLGRMGGNDLVRAGFQRATSLISGRGAYDVGPSTAANVLLSGSDANLAPHFSDGGDELGSIIVTHKEYLTDLYGCSERDNGFVNTSFAINPGLERTFPWLAQTAANFDEYEFVQLMFEFRSTVAQDVNANGQVGTIIMATNYNVTNPAFTDKGTMMQYAGACANKVTDHLLHFVECDPAQLSGSVGKYIRSAPVLLGSDPKQYDLGNFQIAVSGTPTTFANQPIGELWVTYKIKTRKPKIFTGQGLAVSTDQYALAAPISFSTSTTPYQWLGNINNLLVAQQSSIQTKATWVPEVGLLRLDWPAMTVGFFEIKVLSEIYLTLGGLATSDNIRFIMKPMGAMSLVNDIVGSDGYAITGNVNEVYQNIGPTPTYANWIGHVQATPLYGDSDKFVYIGFEAFAAQNEDTVRLNSFTVIITEYNTLSAPGTIPTFVTISNGTVQVPSS